MTLSGLGCRLQTCSCLATEWFNSTFRASRQRPLARDCVLCLRVGRVPAFRIAGSVIPCRGAGRHLSQRTPPGAQRRGPNHSPIHLSSTGLANECFSLPFVIAVPSEHRTGLVKWQCAGTAEGREITQGCLGEIWILIGSC